MNAAVLCSGIGGAELALKALGCTVRWHAEVDPDAIAVHDHHWPWVPNVGDITTADWSTVEPVDLLHASYPCQPFSQAGRRQGLDDDRNLWPAVRDAVAHLRPRWVTLENVAGHVTRGLLTVLGDLAALGFDAEWGVLGSADVGGCHRRDRLWIVAADASRGPVGPSTIRVAECTGPLVARHDRPAVADAGSDRRERSAMFDGEPQSAGPEADGSDVDRRTLPAHVGPLLPTPTPTASDGSGGPGCSGRDGGDNLRTAVHDFGRYRAAVDRWAALHGPPPPPTEANTVGGRRLHAPFSEWMMGFPSGWCTDLISRRAALRCIGNAVQPQTAAVAYRELFTRHHNRQAVTA